MSAIKKEDCSINWSFLWFLNKQGSDFPYILINRRTFIYVIILTFGSVGKGFCQGQFVLYDNLFKDPNSEINFFIKESINPCGINPKLNKFQLELKNVADNKFYIEKYLNWRLNIENCNGDVITRIFSVRLDDLQSDGFVVKLDWQFEGVKILGKPFQVVLDFYPDLTRDFVLRRNINIQADSISGKKLCVEGENVDLKINGGFLTKGSKWVWYENKCGAKKIGEGEKIQIKTTSTTTYLVRGENSNGQYSECTAITVVVDNNSYEPFRIIGQTKVCKGSKFTLGLEGGRLGLGAKWKWYKDDCTTGKFIGEGDTILVSADVSGNYFVKAEGISNTTNCKRINVEVLDFSIKPDKIEGTEQICQGESVQFIVSGGFLGNAANWVWYYSKVNNTSSLVKVGTGVNLDVYSPESGYYFVRAEGFCNNSSFLLKSLNVLPKSEIPREIIAQPLNKLNSKFKLKLNGGALVNNASWIWYKGNCKEQKIGTGNDVIVRAKKNTIYSVSPSDKCSESLCRSISLSRKPNRFIFFNLGFSGAEINHYPNLNLTVGSKKFYVKAKWHINALNTHVDRYSLDPAYNVSQGQIIDNSTFPYLFNGDVTLTHNAVTGGALIGGNVFRFYLGGGYSKVNQLFGVDFYAEQGSSNPIATALVRNVEYSREGLETEGGIFINLRPINIISGMSFSFNDFNFSKPLILAHAGIGITF